MDHDLQVLLEAHIINTLQTVSIMQWNGGVADAWDSEGKTSRESLIHWAETMASLPLNALPQAAEGASWVQDLKRLVFKIAVLLWNLKCKCQRRHPRHLLKKKHHCKQSFLPANRYVTFPRKTSVHWYLSQWQKVYIKTYNEQNKQTKRNRLTDREQTDGCQMGQGTGTGGKGEGTKYKLVITEESWN